MRTFHPGGRTTTMVCAALALAAAPAFSFSSAENASHHRPAQHLGYVAFVQDGQLDALKALAKPDGADALLLAAGIAGLQTFSASVDGKTLLFARNVTPNDTSVSAAWQRAMDSAALKPWFEAQADRIEPHPRAAAAGEKWLPIEQVFFYRGANDREPGKQARACAAITGLKPEMEMQYRTLHQTTWPSVLAAIRRANIANYSIYLVEIGEKLYLLSYFDYMGDDFEGDMGGVGKDPATVRWWKHTDPCQLPLPEAAAAKKIWSDLVPVN